MITLIGKRARRTAVACVGMLFATAFATSPSPPSSGRATLINWIPQGQSRPSMTPPGMSLSAILPASASLVSVVARTARWVNDPSFMRILN
jgi:hypothetical protein